MAKTPSAKLTAKHLIGYGAGDCGGVCLLYMVSGFMTRYIQVHLQFDPTILATMLLIWNVWDAVNDPMMGTLMDMSFAKAKNKTNKFRPWILRSIPIMVIGMITFYSVPTMVSGIAQMASLFALKIVFEAGYTMMNIGMGSLLGVMATNDAERASLSSARGFGSTIGGLVGGAIIPQLIAKFGDNPQGYAKASVIMAIVGGIIVFLHYAWTEERNVTAQNAVQEQPSEEDKVKVTDILQVFKKNRAYLALCLHSICICMVQGIQQQAGTYMYADVLGDIGLMSYTTLVSTALMMVMLTVTPILAKKFDLVRIIRVSLLIGMAMEAALFAYMMTPNPNGFLYLVWGGLAGAFITLSVQMQWGLVGESIDYNEFLTGKRSEGSIYGTFSLTRRIGTTIASSLSVLLISWIGYDPALTAAGLSQTAATITGLKVLNILVPVAGALGSWAAFTFVWNINKDVRAKMAEWKASKAAN